MKPQQLTAGLETLDGLAGVESLCCFVTEDERPFGGATGFVDWRLCGELSRTAASGFFRGAPAERLLLPTRGALPARRLFLVGLGRADALSKGALEQALEGAARMLAGAQVASVALAFPTLPGALVDVLGVLVDRHFAPHFPGAVAVFSG